MICQTAGKFRYTARHCRRFVETSAVHSRCHDVRDRRGERSTPAASAGRGQLLGPSSVTMEIRNEFILYYMNRRKVDVYVDIPQKQNFKHEK